MLRITVEERTGEVVVRLEGRLEQPWVPEVESAVSQHFDRSKGDLQITVDLCGLTGVDDPGEAVLQGLYERGARLRCADVMNGYLVERIAHGGTKPFQEPCRPYHWTEPETA